MKAEKPKKKKKQVKKRSRKQYLGKKGCARSGMKTETVGLMEKGYSMEWNYMILPQRIWALLNVLYVRPCFYGPEC